MKTNTDKSATDDSPDAMRSWESEKQSAYLYRVMREVEPDTMRSQRELFEHQIGLERDELQLYPAQEAEELALIYQARGVPAGKDSESNRER
jgi:hypothetical protein